MPRYIDEDKLDAEILGSVTRLLKNHEEAQLSSRQITENFSKGWKDDIPSTPKILESIGRLEDAGAFSVRKEGRRWTYSLTVKRGRGRPRKVQVEMAATEMPKRRGRPPKNGMAATETPTRRRRTEGATSEAITELLDNLKKQISRLERQLS